jgi:hypothetical protein
MGSNNRTRANGQAGPITTAAALVRLEEDLVGLQREAESLLRKPRPKRRKSATAAVARRSAVGRLAATGRWIVRQLGLDSTAERVDVGTQRLREILEKESSERLHQLLAGLDIPTRGEIQSVSKRLASLEKRLGTSTDSKTSTSRPRRFRGRTRTSE